MKKHQVEFNLPVTILKEGESFVAYSSAIELSSVGDTFEEARRMFEEAAIIFFEELMENNTLEEVLGELGWQRNDHQLSPPVVISNQMMPLSFPNTSALAYA